VSSPTGCWAWILGGYPAAMRVRVDAEACTGHGRCYSLAPEMFSADDVGHCVLLHEDVPEGLEHQARLGVQNCPERAITVED
jgi:ferredoxin